MKKTLYYNIIFRELGCMYNEGFIIINLSDERIISMEGILTYDYIKVEMEGNNFVIKYYISDEFSQTLTLEHVFIIQKDNLELPLNVIFEIVDGIVPYIISLPIGKLVCPYLLHTKVLVPA